MTFLRSTTIVVMSTWVVVAMYSSRFSLSVGVVSIGGDSRWCLKSSRVVLASFVHWNFPCPLRSLKKGSPRSPSLEMNLFNAAMHRVNFCTSLMVTEVPLR